MQCQLEALGGWFFTLLSPPPLKSEVQMENFHCLENEGAESQTASAVLVLNTGAVLKNKKIKSGAEDLSPMGCTFSEFPEGCGDGGVPRRTAGVEESPLRSDELLWENTLPMRQLKWDFTA